MYLAPTVRKQPNRRNYQNDIAVFFYFLFFISNGDINQQKGQGGQFHVYIYSLAIFSCSKSTKSIKILY